MSITASPDPVAAAFEVDERHLRDADALAERIATDKLTADDDANEIRAVFGLAGFDEAGAAKEVQRHREILVQQRLLADARAAGAEAKTLDAKVAKIAAKRAEAMAAFQRELEAFAEPLRRAHTRAQMARDAEQQLRSRLLPRHVRLALERVQQRRNELAARERQLRRQIADNAPTAIDRDIMAMARFEKTRQVERDRVETTNARRGKARKAAEQGLAELMASRAQIDEEDQALRAVYL